MRIGYCRVSTKSAEQTASVETQAQRLQDCGCERVLVDHGISGFREAGRKGSCFPELIDLILDGTATEVVVPHFDRTQRRLRWGMELLDALENSGVRLLELDTGTWLDPANNPTDVLMAQIRTAVQENESRVRRLKVRKALAARRARGEYPTGKLPFGYAVEAGRIVQHPENWELAQQRWQQLEAMAFNLTGWIKASGVSMTPRGVKAWVMNPILRGEVRNRPDLSTPPLITAAQWAAAERALALRSLARGVGGNRQVRLFTGMVRCDACGKNLHTTTDRRTWRLKCLHRLCERYGRGIRVDVVRAAVIAALARQHLALAAAATAPEESPEALRIREAIAHLERADVPGVEVLIEQQKAQLARLQRQPSDEQLRLLDELFADPRTLELATDEELRAVMLEFVASISWPGGWESLTITLR